MLFLGNRDGLHLHAVHSREPSDGGLVQLSWRTILARPLTRFFELDELLFEFVAHPDLIQVVLICHVQYPKEASKSQCAAKIAAADKGKSNPMQMDQLFVFAVLALSMAAFVWGRFRYDIVAMAALAACLAFGVVRPEAAFEGFAQPAVITVALVFVLSKALNDSDAIERLALPMARLADRPLLFMSALVFVGALLSGFMNNVGALALLLPMAMGLSKRPSMVLMPLAFGTLLGGLSTKIGTPPNLIVSSFRESVTGEGFGLFSFTPIGGVIAVFGCLFLVVVGWRLLPRGRQAQKDHGISMKIADYVAEVEIPLKPAEDFEPSADELPGSQLWDMMIFKLEAQLDGAAQVVGIMRGNVRLLGSIRHRRVKPGDILLVQAGPKGIDTFLKVTGLQLHGVEEFKTDNLPQMADIDVMEAVVMPGSRLEGRSPKSLHLRRRFNTNLLAIAREGRPIRERLGRIKLNAGDVLLLQGETSVLPDTIADLGCLPLAQRTFSVEGRAKANWWPLIIFGGAIALTALTPFPVQATFFFALVAMLVVGFVDPKGLYSSIEWPIVILLGAMSPIGGALQETGATDLVADFVVGLSGASGPVVLLIVVMVLTMVLSDLMNNAATAIVMAPISWSVALNLGVNPDAFLMAVAIGASCAFLTPIGHQNNLLVMGPGGYKFADYWRMGLPLQALVGAMAIPLILWVFPL